MSVQAPAESSPSAAENSCARCGIRLQSDQEWCLECGAAARTRIEGAPDWRVPVAIVVSVILLAGAGLAVALIKLSSDANRSAAVATTSRAATAAPAPTPETPPASTPSPAPTPAATPPAVTTPAATTPSASATTTGATRTGATARKTRRTSTVAQSATRPPPVQIGSWPVGLGGWTVVLATSRDRASAEATATQIGAGGTQVGILNSSDHKSMTPGYWVVFSGRYPNRAQAQAAAARFTSQGQSGARARIVEPPGGN